MTWPALPLVDGNTLILDNSTTQTLITCPTMGAYRVLCKREKASAAPERDAGKLLHMCLEYRYRTCGSKAPTTAQEQAMLDIIDNNYGALKMPDDTHLTPVRLKDVVLEYNKTRGVENFDVLGVEIPFMTQLGVVDVPRLVGPIRVMWTGRSDMIVRFQPEGLVTLFDHKTCGRWDNSKLAQFEVDDGQRGYAWSMQELARQYPDAGLPPKIHGFTVNGLVIRKEAKTARATLPRFESVRHTFYFTAEQLEEWRENMLIIVRNWLTQYATGTFAMHRRNCAFYYGTRCGYWDVCCEAKERRAMILGFDAFRDITWDPINRRENGGDEV